MAASPQSRDLLDVEGVADLYDEDPSSFVAARAELVRALKAQGDKVTAAEVAKLRKPSVVAAAVNRAVRADPELVEGLITSSARVADAQRAALADGDAEPLRAAAGERRRALAELVGKAARHVGAARTAEVSSTVEAALADEELVDRLRRGALTDTLEAPAGFGFGAGDEGLASVTALHSRRARSAATPRSTRGNGGATRDEVADRSGVEDERARRKEARERRRALEKEVAGARRELGRQETAVEAAQADLEAAEAALAAARERLSEVLAGRDEATEEVRRLGDELASLADG